MARKETDGWIVSSGSQTTLGPLGVDLTLAGVLELYYTHQEPANRISDPHLKYLFNLF